MTIQFLILLASLVLLFLGAEGLVRGSASMALRAGLTPLVVGLTVVAFGTSSPELVVSIGATLAGQGDIAVGNVVGSNIFNVGLILGLVALICPIRIGLPVLKIDAPLMLIASVVVGVILLRGSVGSLVGLSLVFWLVVYTGLTVWMARRPVAGQDAESFADEVPGRSASLWLDLLYMAAGLALLIFGSQLLVHSATTIAAGFGIRPAIIALTVVAAGTSMPELATSLVAALRRQPDLAVGNIVGSNTFNLLGILGTAAVVRPISAPGVHLLDLLVMVILAAALLPLMWTRQTLQRWEGTLLLAGYGFYLYMIWPK